MIICSVMCHIWGVYYRPKSVSVSSLRLRDNTVRCHVNTSHQNHMISAVIVLVKTGCRFPVITNRSESHIYNKIVSSIYSFFNFLSSVSELELNLFLCVRFQFICTCIHPKTHTHTYTQLTERSLFFLLLVFKSANLLTV